MMCSEGSVHRQNVANVRLGLICRIMSASADTTESRFEIAISFAGPHRDKVRAIAERLSEAIDPGIEDRSKGRVFFDEWFRHEILGSDMDVLLQNIYQDQSLMVVADLSEEHADRPWTQAEARAIRALRMQLDTARDETARLRLLNIRFGDGDLPGVFNTEGWLDGIELPAEEITEVILKRRELLQGRLGNEESDTTDPADHSSPGWVWRSSLATRAADKVSILAVVETVLAIVLYWWIAIRFETHWHLVSSVFIAPLLLLRSPESTDAGVQWFLKDWFGIEPYKGYAFGTRQTWFVLSSLITSGLTYGFANEMSQRWLTGLYGWQLFGWSSAIGAISLTFVVAVVYAFTNSTAGTDLRVPMVTLAVAVAGCGPIAIAGATLAAIAAPIPGLGAGVALRALIFRILATLLHLLAGVHRIPANWIEANLRTDSSLPAELMPGIRDHEPDFTLDGILTYVSNNRGLGSRVLVPILGIFVLLPPVLYRLNIKATAWFWWPLAYLLKPAPAASVEGEQRQALCWPWSNPAQRWLIVLSIGLALTSVLLHWLMAGSRIVSDFLTALPLAVRVSLGAGWNQLAAWHVALWIIAAAGVGMLLLAGNACSHHANGNWKQYRRRWPQNIRWMTALSRVRRLATVALLVMSFGALLLQDDTWRNYIPIPAGWVTALEGFYRTGG